MKPNLIILFLAAAAITFLSLTGCKKEDPKSVESWVVTFTLRGTGTYSYQANLGRQGHVGNPGEPTGFAVAAKKGTLISIEAIADTVGQDMSISMSIEPEVDKGYWHTSGPGLQHLEYQN